MDKEDFIKTATGLYEEALEASSYYALIMELRSAIIEKNTIINLSPAFYRLVLSALQQACFMDIAKLFDKSEGVISVGKLLITAKQNIQWFPQYREIIKSGDNSSEIKIPYQHYLKDNEKRFFEDEVKRQIEIQKLLNIYDDNSICVDLTFSELLDLYQKTYCSLSKIVASVHTQRNKIYAHNDSIGISDIDSILKRNPISLDDMKTLIDFSQDAIGLIIETTTGVCKAKDYINIDDIENTLNMAELGHKYHLSSLTP